MYAFMADLFVPSDVLMGVLARLPAKSLMRFKSVSKQWYSLITDPVFADMYRTQKRAPLLAIPPFINPTSDTNNPSSWHMIDTNSNKVCVHNLPSLPSNTNCVSNIVDGLVCFYLYNEIDGQVYLHNLATRETIPLSPSTLIQESNTSVYLGFDPNNMEYKVLHLSDGYPYVNCQVFTLGSQENRWRPVTHNFHRLCNNAGNSGICLDGVIYWTRSTLSLDDEGAIFAFNVEHEKFEQIKYPEWAIWNTMLTQIGGELSLVAQGFKNEITLWKLKKPKGNRREAVWLKEDIVCLFFNYEHALVRCTDFGLLFLVGPSYSNGVTIDCYDLVTGRVMTLEVNKSQDRLIFDSRYFTLQQVVEKHIVPLKNIKGRRM